MANDTWLIAGLGNPGDKYAYTWHNCGFLAMELLADKCGISMDRTKFEGLYGKGKYKGKDIILLKPQTFMNLSGESLREVVNFYKVEPENVIVIYDDIDLDQGRLRIRASGSSGSHNGMKSVIYQLQFDNFPRIRVGIGKNVGMPLDAYVLGKPSDEDQKVLDKAIENAADAAEIIVRSSIADAMQKYNTKHAD